MTGGRGKKASTATLATLTERGIRRHLDPQSLKDEIGSLAKALQQIPSPPPPPDPTAFRHVVDQAAAKCVDAIRTAFAGLQDTVLEGIRRPAAQPPDVTAVLAAIPAALGKLEPVIIRLPGDAPPQPAPSSASVPDAEILGFLAEWVGERQVGCPFDILFAQLKRRHPDLSIGAFHDALRRLHEAERIRLGGWPKMLDDMPEPELALFVSSRVIYYAQPAP